jgi:hypothetical protein
MTAPDTFLAQSRTQPKGKKGKEVSDAVPLEVGDGRERISPLLTRRRPCSGPTMPRPGGRRRHVTAGAWARVMGRRRGGGSGRRCRYRDGRSRRAELEEPRWARGTRRLPELWMRRDWESTRVGWGLPPAGAVGAVVWGLHRAPAGAAQVDGGGRRSSVSTLQAFIWTVTFFDREKLITRTYVMCPWPHMCRCVPGHNS